MRIGWLVNATIWKGRCRYEMFWDFAKQSNGGSDREKDLYFFIDRELFTIIFSRMFYAKILNDNEWT
jgi:hypothetical protein